ncbi:MAG: protein-L-isoaspartate(D-aspartate) O-methyltransferase [Bacteroidales bacterium]|nr:protein-L-isoaspartate(D-aspartate) O-methyltransferase [Bacteroidales bacterium]MDD4435455.1 protein-L-isoaspartate(D-aspartate) O-methyltransferase [Bacteroidales bacterium]MDD5732313.1 protein-L-isoaspartate(D-aspartate) O-methyltransferase [Bacteroidales bacterium]
MPDTLRQKGQRRLLIEELARKFAFNPLVLKAMERIPRHIFVEKGLEHLAYKDKPLPITGSQTISQPYTVAMQTHLLDCSKMDKVLEIGTGCGYQAAILMAMGFQVYSIERIWELYLLAQKNIVAAGFDPSGLYFGDGFAGLPQFAPFRGILVTCGAPVVPQTLKNQLAINGKMVIPVGRHEQQMLRITRTGEDTYTTEDFGPYSFVPMLTGTQKMKNGV